MSPGTSCTFITCQQALQCLPTTSTWHTRCVHSHQAGQDSHQSAPISAQPPSHSLQPLISTSLMFSIPLTNHLMQFCPKLLAGEQELRSFIHTLIHSASTYYAPTPCQTLDWESGLQRHISFLLLPFRSSPKWVKDSYDSTP